MKNHEYEYLIIGAGPAGLQLSYEFEKQSHDYMILEAADKPGAFFELYPRHRKLLSINKVYTGHDDTEINLRWDWNSLLADNDELLFKNYSKNYLPDADALVRYLADFANHYKLKITYNTRVIHITRRNGVFILTDTEGNHYHGRRLIMATGVSAMNVPPVPGIEMVERYEDCSIDPQDFVNQSVLIIGKGNSAFETADALIETTTYIHVISPQPLRLAWESRFVGHLRAANNNFLDTYQLKCQNAVLDGIITRIDRKGKQFEVRVDYSHASGETELLHFDRIILAAGFRFDNGVFDEPCHPCMKANGLFPELTAEWESVNVKDLYFAGTLMQANDYKKGTNSFIHGFRYSVRALARILDEKYHQKTWPNLEVATETKALANQILDRVNRTSALWQQFGFMTDLIVIDGTRATYFEEVPRDIAMDERFGSTDTRFIITLEFGKVDGNIFAIERVPEAEAADASTFLHPILYFYKNGKHIDTLHLLEDLHANWRKEVHVTALEAFLERCSEAFSKTAE